MYAMILTTKMQQLKNYKINEICKSLVQKLKHKPKQCKTKQN